MHLQVENISNWLQFHQQKCEPVTASWRKTSIKFVQTTDNDEDDYNFDFNKDDDESRRWLLKMEMEEEECKVHLKRNFSRDKPFIPLTFV